MACILLWARHCGIAARVQKEQRPAKECARVVEECQGLRQTFYACKRGQVDNTKRIRGNKGY